MICRHCDGEGGGTDHYGEWWDCLCCEGDGSATPERHAAYDLELAEIDAEIDRMMAEESGATQQNGRE